MVGLLVGLALLPWAALASDPSPVDLQLMRAVKRRDPDALRAALEAGADPSLELDGLGSPLGLVCLSARGKDDLTPFLSMAAALREAGARVPADPDAATSVLTHCVMSGSLELVRVAVDSGIDLEASYEGRTPAQHAKTFEVMGMGGGPAITRYLETGEFPEDAGEFPEDGPPAIHRDAGPMGMWQRLQELAEREGEAAPPREEAPELEPGAAVRPGRYRGPCELVFSDSPPPGGSGRAAFAVTVLYPVEAHRSLEAAEGPLVQMTAASLLIGGSPNKAVGAVRPPDCAPVELQVEGGYRMVTYRSKQTWRWECAHRNRGGECVRERKVVDESTGRREVAEVEVKGDAPAPPEEPEERPCLEIVAPAAPAQASYSSGDPGRLVIVAEAEVRGEDLDPEEIRWGMEWIAGKEPTIEPETGPRVTITFEGLPPHNTDFGPRRLTASVGGARDSVGVEVFYDPTARNHPAVPGRQEGTPNWYYYWSQTGAGKGVRHRYIPERRSKQVDPATGGGYPTLGQFSREEDLVYVTDLLFETRTCTQREKAGKGPNAWGIDCFAELLIHENQHLVDWKRWWPEGGRGNFVESLNNDADNDFVPRWYEGQRAGCSDDAQRSCADLPPLEGITDLEINAYWAGWEWTLGSVDDEDWSHCGKQWKDRSACPD